LCSEVEFESTGQRKSSSGHGKTIPGIIQRACRGPVKSALCHKDHCVQKMTFETEYANTDFDLKSTTPFDRLQRELNQTCCVLHYTHGDDGHWHSIVESSHDEESGNRNAERDIGAIINAINALSPAAKAQLDACYLREFNIGFHCWDTWAYAHTLQPEVVRSVADINCSIAVTLYPMRNPDGTPKE